MVRKASEEHLPEKSPPEVVTSVLSICIPWVRLHLRRQLVGISRVAAVHQQQASPVGWCLVALRKPWSNLLSRVLSADPHGTIPTAVLARGTMTPCRSEFTIYSQVDN